MVDERKYECAILTLSVLALALDPLAIAQDAVNSRHPTEAAPSKQSETVKITPVGARTGELCARDRALIFEDPTGVRILYDPGITIAGGEDNRLGDVHAILVSHNHFDHIGYQRLTQNPDDPGASCGASPQTIRTGNTTTAEIAAVKNSAVLVNVNMAAFLSQKIQNIRGQPTPACSAGVVGRGPTETVVARSSPCTGALGFGTVNIVTRARGHCWGAHQHGRGASQ